MRTTRTRDGCASESAGSTTASTTADQCGSFVLGQEVLKLDQNGKVLMTLGKMGVGGSGTDAFDRPTGVAVAPILPGLSDGADSLAAVLAAARRSGASFVWPSMVRLQPGTREHFIEALSRDWPELVPRYQQIFAGRTSVPSAVAAPALEAMASLRARWGFSEQPAPRREPPAAPRQLALRL